jgi:hypothetical protein
MQYEFRTRAILGTTVKIESQETELEVFDSGGVRVVIKAAEPETLLTDSRSVVIRALASTAQKTRSMRVSSGAATSSGRHRRAVAAQSMPCQGLRTESVPAWYHNEPSGPAANSI